MTIADVAAALLFLGVVAYAILGGADFGSGVWDLLAGGARDGAHLRSQIDRSIGPVWEANHVWLIYVLVFLWTGFPTAFGAIMTTLFVPWLLVGLGIVLRGGAFAFRKFSSTVREARLHGIVFAASSVVTPFFLGMIAGAIASGRVPADGNGDIWRSWTGATSWVGGALAVLTVAFLAATFLAADAERGGRHELAVQIGSRALWSGIVAGAASLAAAVAIELDAETLADGLHGRGLALVALSAASGMATLVLLRKRRWALARLTAVAAVGSIVIGWGVAQYDWLLVDEMTIADGAGARSTLIGLIIVFLAAAVTAVPAMIWLFVLVNQDEWQEDSGTPG
ncbi:MAG: cytochrome d ubiquinol oxidase subunit II [Ilumatobacteraceae bacterium]|nr:cytochrome d ubiquinol oxidase subunit II [Ilumatobacteraceae bacterium]